MYTAAQAVFGWQQVHNVGDVARFGSLVFQIFSLVQLSLVLFFALLFCASSVAQEKDRRTLVLLLMTDLKSHELVLGKLCSSLLIVLVLIGTSAPVFFLVHLLGGVAWEQHCEAVVRTLGRQAVGDVLCIHNDVPIVPDRLHHGSPLVGQVVPLVPHGLRPPG